MESIEIKEDYLDNIMALEYSNIVLETIPILLKQAKILSNKYEISVTNPPYLSDKGMDTKLSMYLKENYNISKADLFIVYMGVCARISKYMYELKIYFQKLRRG